MWAFYYSAILTTLHWMLAVFLLSDKAIKVEEVVRLCHYTKPIRSCDEGNRNDRRIPLLTGVIHEP
jgi:hypothetical protein